jgi:hypothetical protein
MTYYRDNPYAPQARTPLIDLIPEHREDLYVSDEEDSFYGKEDDFLVPPKWQNRLERIPRRFKRSCFVALGVAFTLLISWCMYFGPRHAAYNEELRQMDHSPAMSYGSNLRPEFKDLIQIKDMDEEHLPKKGKRLVFVGDVHGCREELDHLLKKVDFKHKRDHLVLAGDMITKGTTWFSNPRGVFLLIILRPRLSRRYQTRPQPRRILRPRQLGRQTPPHHRQRPTNPFERRRLLRLPPRFRRLRLTLES